MEGTVIYWFFGRWGLKKLIRLYIQEKVPYRKPFRFEIPQVDKSMEVENLEGSIYAKLYINMGACTT